MLAEQQEYFKELIGQRSDAVDSIGFLTWKKLRELESELDISWRITRPWYGFRWALRPFIAMLRDLMSKTP